MYFFKDSPHGHIAIQRYIYIYIYRALFQSYISTFLTHILFMFHFSLFKHFVSRVDITNWVDWRYRGIWTRAYGTDQPSGSTIVTTPTRIVNILRSLTLPPPPPPPHHYHHYHHHHIYLLPSQIPSHVNMTINIKCLIQLILTPHLILLLRSLMAQPLWLRDRRINHHYYYQQRRRRRRANGRSC